MDKNILIVGGTSGIGKELASILAEDNYKLFLTGRKNDYDGGNVTYTYLDVSEDGDFADGFLPDVLHGLVYCPGTINLKPFTRLSDDDFMEDYKINVLGAVKVLRQAIPALKKAEGASVIMFSTVATKAGMPFHASVAAAKSAVEGLAISLAAEYSQSHIRFNVLAPSITDTPLASRILGSDSKRENSAQRHPLKRVGDAREVAQTVKFLLSADSGWVTGQVWAIDGGLAALRS